MGFPRAVLAEQELPRVVLTPGGSLGPSPPWATWTPPFPDTQPAPGPQEHKGHLLDWTQTPRAGRGSAVSPQPWGQHPGEIPPAPHPGLGPKPPVAKTAASHQELVGSFPSLVKLSRRTRRAWSVQRAPHRHGHIRKQFQGAPARRSPPAPQNWTVSAGDCWRLPL